MIREIIVSDKVNLMFPLPKNYLHKKLEVIIFPVDEKKEVIKRKKRVAGMAKGMFKMSKDFDAPLNDFKEYMP
ncbi:MAG: DUF2281 domain-containing protein [Victivallales bacterium]|jgi:hypothetical protein